MRLSRGAGGTEGRTGTTAERDRAAKGQRERRGNSRRGDNGEGDCGTGQEWEAAKQWERANNRKKGVESQHSVKAGDLPPRSCPDYTGPGVQ